MDDFSMEDYILHYGVKGMKWGVRKDRNKGFIRTPKQRKQERIVEEGGTIVPIGTTFNRISTKAEKNPHPTRSYVTYTEVDHDYYKQHMTNFRSRNFTRQMYDVSLKNIKDVAYPSHEKQVDEFVKLYGKHKVRVINDMATESADRIARINTGQPLNRLPKDFQKELRGVYTKKYSELNADELRSFGYEEFIRTYSEIPVARVYEKQLRKQGYNAIRDDNDILYNRMDSINPEKSIVVFEPSRNLKVTGSVPLTRSEYDAAVARNSKRRKKSA